MKSPEESERTSPLTGTGRQQVPGHAPGPTVALVLYHRHGAAVVPLHPGHPVTVGRDSPADAAIADPSLSRRHARFFLDGGTLSVEDLGSTNGTRVRGERITRAAIRPGEPVLLGAVVATAHVRGPFERELGGLAGHDDFVGALEREITRARFFAESFAVLVLRGVGSSSGTREAAHVSSFSQRVQAALRPVDLIALYSDDSLEILAPRITAADARALADACVATGSRGRPLRCGIAFFPDTASSADALIQSARQATLEATAKEPVRPSAVGPTAVRPDPGADEEPTIRSPAMRQLFEQVEQLSKATLPVLILGETGTGKEVVARALHEGGPRRGRPLVSVNCGALPAQLVESTLFGHVRGAFTGADRTSDGVFLAANGGTVLLDEVADLPASAQVALLRVLETRRVTRVGATEEVPVDIRVVAATHRDLDAMCEAGSFRRDLLYRLEVATLLIPPLRERVEEIPILAERFLATASIAAGRTLSGISAEAMDLLLRYRWPGNVRELRNAIERAAVIARGDRVEALDLPQRVRANVRPPAPEYGEADDGDDDDCDPLKVRVRRFETRVIVQALRREDGNQTHAARRLGIPLRTLMHKLKMLGIRRADYAPNEV